jgi:hypothetical protein
LLNSQTAAASPLMSASASASASRSIPTPTARAANQPARFRSTSGSLSDVCRSANADSASRIMPPPAHRFSSTPSPNGGDNVKRAVLGSLTLRWVRRRRSTWQHGGHSS